MSFFLKALRTHFGKLPAALLLFALALSAPFAAAETGNGPATLLQIAGVEARPTSLSDSVVVIIDAQREYADGRLPLADMDSAVRETARLLALARRNGTPVIHIVHQARPGSALFDPAGPFVDVIPELAPQAGETVIAKTLPNAFAGTVLEKRLAQTGRKNLIVAGFMTHMCVSATVRAALDVGYRTTVVESATATRDLPDGAGGTVPATMVQRAEIAALRDRFAAIVGHADDLPVR
ncbi:MAG: cysteine hydrolase family protein [Sulfuricella sp.]|nr:cysteine hydrolase family protein [Sulfuricella sp.]